MPKPSISRRGVQLGVATLLATILVLTVVAAIALAMNQASHGMEPWLIPTGRG